MGRKPDVLIATYFDRGTKLQDASNRYSFTCKGCGSEFPKGRTSHLLSHLIGKKRCLALTQHDIASILAMQASKSAEKAQRTPTKRTADYSFLNQGVSASDGRPSKKQALTTDTGRNGLSGLEALAEASRRVEMPVEDHVNTRRSFSFSYQSLIDPVLDPFASLVEGNDGSPSDTLEMAVSLSNPERSLPPSRGQDTGNDTPSIYQDFGPLQTPPSEDLADQLTKAASYGVLIAAGPQREIVFESQTIKDHKPSRARAKFTEARREEVRSVRSKRACIRCRMLRKPCSAEDPCSRCSSVKNPRIWSSHCVRGRLDDVCDLWLVRFNTEAINSNVAIIQQKTDASEVNGYLSIGNRTGPLPWIKFAATLLKAPQSEQAQSSVLEVIVPLELSHAEGDRVRSALLYSGVRAFPVEVQDAIAYGRSLQIDSEKQLFIKAESVYRCTYLLVFSSTDFHLSFDENKLHQSASIGTISSRQPLELAFKSIVESLAQQDCYRLLKRIEQALIDRNIPSPVVLLSSLMLFFSLDLLEYHFFTQLNQGTTLQSENVTDASKTVFDWSEKLQTFSRFMQDLLRCRHIIEQLQVHPTTRVIEVTAMCTDPAARELFERLNIHSSLLQNGSSSCVSGNPGSVYFKHAANMLLFAQPNELLS